MDIQFKHKGQKLKGIVKMIYSGDRIVLYGPKDKEGLFCEKVIQLICVKSPRMGMINEKKNEKFAIDVREYLRKKLIGQQVEFYIEEKLQGVDVGSVYYQQVELSQDLLQKGYVQLINKKDNANIQLYREAEKQAKDNNLGIWNTSNNSNDNQDIVLQVEDLNSYLKENNNKELSGIVESVLGQTLLVNVNQSYSIKVEMEDLVFGKLEEKQFKKVKQEIEQLILQRDIKFKIKGLSNNGKQIKVDIIGDKGQQLKKELLKKGYCKVSVDCSDYKYLKQVQDQAQIDRVGIWTDYNGNTNINNSNINSNSNEFIGQVLEVSSGDCLTIQNCQNLKIQRYNLSNFRSPQIGNSKKQEQDKPYAFEAKEALRKLIIGKKVQVTLDYSRQIQKDPKDTAIQLMFVTVICNNICAQVYLLEQGLGNVQMSKQDENCSKCIQDMKQAETNAIQQKLGVHSNQVKNVVRFNEVTQKKGRQFEAFIKDEGKIQAVIEYVLSGQRVKVRLIKHNSLIIMNLQGIRTLSNDANLSAHQLFSNKALSFLKETVNQRDCVVEIDNCDNKGVFHGTIFLNNRNINSEIIEQGLAYVYNKSKYNNEYIQCQNQAKQNKRGIWGSDDLNLEDEEESRVSQQLDYSKQVMITEIKDVLNIYVQQVDSQMNQINKIIDSIHMNKQPKLEQPIKKGTPCLAIFSEDGEWYRAKIIQKKNLNYQVQFIDFGNLDECPLDDIRKIPNDLNAIPPQADLTQLAYVKPASINHEIGDTVYDNLSELLLNQEMTAKFVSQDGNYKKIILYSQGKNSPQESVNAKLITHGYAKLSNEELPKDFQFLKDEEEKAINNKVGIWQFDDEDEQL